MKTIEQLLTEFPSLREYRMERDLTADEYSSAVSVLYDLKVIKYSDLRGKKDPYKTVQRRLVDAISTRKT